MGKKFEKREDGDLRASGWRPAFRALLLLLITCSMSGGCGERQTSVDSRELNRPPQSSAGPDQTVSVGESVVLDGTASTDPC